MHAYFYFDGQWRKRNVWGGKEREVRGGKSLQNGNQLKTNSFKC